MNTKEILIAARQLVEKPERWTQGVFARDLNGRPVDLLGPHAKCFCISGAVGRVVKRDHAKWDQILELLAKTARRRNIVRFNDANKRTHAEVLAAFDRAIAAA